MKTRMVAPKRFLGVDGESITIDGEHRYVLLMDSDGRSITNLEGLDTVQCLDFLLDCPKQSIPVAFGSNYDVNMMLRDMGRKRLEDLWAMNQTAWFHYQLEWIPGKWFRIHNAKTDQRVKLSEVFGFFQSSFVTALERWGFTPPPSMGLMKLARAEFTEAMLGDVAEYCLTECRMLAEMMEKLRQSTQDCGLKVSGWHGAGAIATGVMKQHQVKRHMINQEEHPELVQDAIMRAYFGGRTELFLQGEVGRVYQQDIVSAYPWAATFLPSLKGGKWVTTDFVSPNADGDHGLYRIKWNAPSPLITPFPVRIQGKRIIYPTTGEGWYHACEVRTAIELGFDVTVSEGYVFLPASEERPFDFIPELAALKIQYKQQGHGGEKVLKLGINSLYGKLAQGMGFRGQRPAYQSYFWAGEITARTRARMLQLAMKNPRWVVMIATDGIFTTKPLFGTSGTAGLGGIDVTILDNMFAAQPGVYSAEVNGEQYAKSRGFFVKEINFDSVKEGWREDGPWYVGRYSSTRFVGLGTALSRKDFGVWRTWHEGERKLSLYPSYKRVDFASDIVRHYPPERAMEMSLPYVPKGGLTDEDLEHMQGKEQPLREDM